MSLQPSPDGGGKLGSGVHGCFGGIDHNNALLMTTLGMGCNFLVGAALLVKGRKRFAWITDVKWQKQCERKNLSPQRQIDSAVPPHAGKRYS